MSSCADCPAPCGGNPEPRVDVIDASNIKAAQAGYIGDWYVRPMSLLKDGSPHDGHAHHTDHMTRLNKGKVRIEWRNPITGEQGTVEAIAPCYLPVLKDVEHRFIALEDAEWDCIFHDPANMEDKPAGVFHQERPRG